MHLHVVANPTLSKALVRDIPQAASCSSAPSAYLKNLYFDTLVYDVDTLDFLGRKVGAQHLLLGTAFLTCSAMGWQWKKPKRSIVQS
jgi:hypothetical protein